MSAMPPKAEATLEHAAPLRTDDWSLTNSTARNGPSSRASVSSIQIAASVKQYATLFFLLLRCKSFVAAGCAAHLSHIVLPGYAC